MNSSFSPEVAVKSIGPHPRGRIHEEGNICKWMQTRRWAWPIFANLRLGQLLSKFAQLRSCTRQMKLIWHMKVHGPVNLMNHICGFVFIFTVECEDHCYSKHGLVFHTDFCLPLLRAMRQPLLRGGLMYRCTPFDGTSAFCQNCEFWYPWTWTHITTVCPLVCTLAHPCKMCLNS